MSDNSLRDRFWETVSLDAMTRFEWEALCDGCGKCCVLKLEDEDTGEVAYTNIACRLLDPETCRCGQYALRRQLVPGCVVITPENIDEVQGWMPKTCAYRLLANGKPLENWHPLISGSQSSVTEAGISVAGKLVPEYEVSEDDWEDYIVEDPD
jgi:uncharacterized cysteine cluster protein YcgN (CxxCxxCC family)